MQEQFKIQCPECNQEIQKVIIGDDRDGEPVGPVRCLRCNGTFDYEKIFAAAVECFATNRNV